MEVRTLADWVVRQRLLTIPGVSQVITMGGGRKQYQVLVNPNALLTYGVTLDDVEAALAQEQRQRHRRIPRPAGAERVSGPLAGPHPIGRGPRERGGQDPRRPARAAEPGGPRGRRAGGQTRRRMARVNSPTAVRRRPGRDADRHQAARRRHAAADRAGHRGAGGTESRRCRPTSASNPNSTSRRSSSTWPSTTSRRRCATAASWW